MRRPPTDSPDIIIPRKPEPSGMEKTLEESNEHLEDIATNIFSIQKNLSGERKLTPGEKQTVEMQEESLEEQKKMHPILRMLTTYFVNPLKNKYDKIRQKLTDKYNTIFVKGKFFEKIKDVFKKLIDSLTGSWLTKLFGAILALAIFDPKGKILGKIIGHLLTAVTFILNMIGNYVPVIIKNVIHIVSHVLPDIIRKILDGIFNALYNMFDIWVKQFPKESIMYKILSFVRNIFAKDSPLLSFLKTLTNYIPFIIAGLAGLKILIPIITGIKALTLFLMANPIVAIIAGIVLAFTALWVFKDKIAKFFESIFEWFSKLGIGFKILGIAIAIVLAPLTAIIAAIYGIVKLFQSFKKRGIKETFKLIWKYVKQFFKDLWFQLKKIPSLFLKALSKPLFGLPDLIIKGLSRGFEWLVNLNTKFANFVTELFSPVKDFFSEIIMWFKTISNVGLLNYLTKGARYRERAEQLTRMVESTKEIEKAKGYSPKELAVFSAAGASPEYFNKFLNELVKTRDQEVKVMVENIQKIEEKSKTREEYTRPIVQPKIVPSIVR